MGNIHTVGPNEALIVSGGCSDKRKMVIGSWAWAWWLVSDVQRLSLAVMTLRPHCDRVETAQGVALTVNGVAQCKVMKEHEFLATAAEQFLGKTSQHIKSVILQTLEGHLRAILGTLTVEEIYRDRDQFAALVREVAAPDIGHMGIEILSFTIKDVVDQEEYLTSLGRARTAAVKRDASIGVAQAERDAGIREAECDKSAMDVKYGADTKVEDAHRMFELKKAQYDAEVNTSKAEASLAYELQAAKLAQSIRAEELEIDVVERRKEIDVEEKEIQRREKELTATIRLPAEAEAYRLEMIAKGARTQKVEAARADAEKIKLTGAAEAFAIEAVGKADAERMRLRTSAQKQFGEAAMLSRVLDALPNIAGQIARPLAKVEEIVLLSGEDRTAQEVGRLCAQLPPTVQALTGVDISKILTKIPGAS